jgi:acyl-[acyl-carrier-protein] desaturase
MALMEDLEGCVGENLSLLTAVEQAWQPTDFLPDLTGEDWSEQLAAFRASTRQISDELLVVLVGNMVTEEALPNYANALAWVSGVKTGDDVSPWGLWLRGWTAEENRHGDLLNAFLRLTGRVDMRSVERTIHHLIRNGFTARHHGNPCAGMVYTAFQERATRISHGNVARLAAAQGDEGLGRICRRIAGDESRHETFYTRIVAKAIERDPEEGVLAFREMLRGIIAMPGRLMDDGRDPNLFEHFSTIAQRTGVYTARSYAQVIEHLIETWGIAHLSVTGKAAKAQEYLCRQPERYASFADEIAESVAKQPPVKFGWIQGRET